MTAPARLAEVEVCDEYACRVGLMLVRADQVSFVTTEQVRDVGRYKLDSAKMPSDLRMPASHVLVHDTTGELLNRCDLYIVRWHKQHTSDVGSSAGLIDNASGAVADARTYFGNGTQLRYGLVDVPEGRWQRFARVQFIRYRRAGNEGGLYEHEYEPPVDLYGCKSPLAWRIALPSGCVVDERGFVWP